jgi:hypothetical protein
VKKEERHLKYFARHMNCVISAWHVVDIATASVPGPEDIEKGHGILKDYPINTAVLSRNLIRDSRSNQDVNLTRCEVVPWLT